MNIGKKVGELRKNSKLTLAEISKKSGVALATLSRIENGKMVGTLKSHISIAKALNTTLPELYSDINKSVILQQKEAFADFFIHNKHVRSTILTKGIFTKKMLPIFVSLKRGGKTDKEELKSGTEKFIYLLQGKAEVVVGEERNKLYKGAAIYFNASRPHYIRNISNTTASYLCVIAPTIY